MLQRDGMTFRRRRGAPRLRELQSRSMATIAQHAARRLGFHRFLRLLRFYPPFVGAGVRVTAGSADGSHVTVEMPLTVLNRNFVGTHFGGSLYAMCDPFFMLMLMHRLGPDYVVWDKAARIEFLRPGRGTVRATFLVSDDRLAEIRREANGAGKALPEFEVTVVGDDGAPVARVHKTLHVRPKVQAG
jgi:acyl-coenzyme A thioesterase PaaI-like protein